MTYHIHQSISAYAKGPGHPVQTATWKLLPHVLGWLFFPRKRKYFRKPKHHMENKRGDKGRGFFWCTKGFFFFPFCYIRNGRSAVQLESSGNVAGETGLSLASHRLWHSCHVIRCQGHRRECLCQGILWWVWNSILQKLEDLLTVMPSSHGHLNHHKDMLLPLTE